MIPSTPSTTPRDPGPRAAVGRAGPQAPTSTTRIREILGRRPTSAELAMYSVMWSEHCSYKSSKVHLKKFGDLPQETPLGKTLAGIGENAGVIDIGQGYAVTFKVESHNHPQLRRALPGRGDRRRRHRPRHPRDGRPPGRGHGPAALRPARRRRHPPGAARHRRRRRRLRQLPRVCPTSAARSSSTRPTSATRWSTPCASACSATRTSTSRTRRGVGNQVVLYGARTGGDGIGGVSVLASETFDADGPGEAARASRSATRSWRSC